MEFCMTCEGDGMEGEGGVRVKRITDLVNDLTKRAELRLELSIVAIVCTPIIRATYNCEGEAPALSMVTYDVIMGVDACTRKPTSLSLALTTPSTPSQRPW